MSNEKNTQENEKNTQENKAYAQDNEKNTQDNEKNTQDNEKNTQDNEEFTQEQELAQLEEKVGQQMKELAVPPLREEFPKELRCTLQTKIKAQSKETFMNKLRTKIKFPRSFNWKYAACFLGFLLLCGGLLWGMYGGESGEQPIIVADGIEIKALEEDQLGVDAESAFLLTSLTPLEQKTITEHLKVEPTFEYSLAKSAGGKEYKIIPKNKLAANTVYQLSFDPAGKEQESFSWAFQTKKQFRITRTLPWESTSNVPLDTGIEITFSHENFQVEQAEEYFSVSPRIKGRFEKHKKVMVFVPDQQLKPQTIYTVTVKKDFPLIDSTETLAADYIFSFETRAADDGQRKKEVSININNQLVEFSTSEVPVFIAYSYSSGSSGQSQLSTVNISLYQYAEHKAFIKALQQKDQVPGWSYFARENYREDFSKQTKVGAYKTDLLSVSDNAYYFSFPEKLPAGYYAAEIQVAGIVEQVWFQVTDLAVYEAQSETTSLFWVNDLQTKKPVAGAQLSLEDLQLSFKGNDLGVIFVEQKLNVPDGSYALIKKDRQEIVVPLFTLAEITYEDEEQKFDIRDYWKYLYVDRELYKPGDTVKFWGVLAPRKGAEAIQEVEVQINPYSYSSEDERRSFVSKKVKIEDQIFTGEIELPKLSPDYYCLHVKKDGNTILTRWISVDLYQKPNYKISVEPEKQAIFTGEKVNFLAAATFFEGTAVPKTDLQYTIRNNKGLVTTDARGEALIPYSPALNSVTSTYCDSAYLGVSASMPETGEITASGKVWVFGSKIYLDGQTTRQGKNFTVDTQLFNIDLERINAGADLTKNNFITDPVPGLTVKGQLYQDIWEKEEDGSYYNFITKKVEKRYYYQHSTKHIQDFTMITDSTGKAVYQGTVATEGSYYVLLTFEDADGRRSERRFSIWENSNDGYYYYKYYHLQLENEKTKFAVGDQVSLKFMENAQELPAREQGFLFWQGQKEIERFTVLNGPKYEFTYRTEDLPNVNVGGVYFDGRVYQKTAVRSVYFQNEEKALRISIDTDKPEYRPQEKVKLQIRVTDLQNKPVQAKVNLNLVDEALYQLMDQEANFLSTLYDDGIYLNLRTRFSHYQEEYGGGAECGGEGGSERKDFSDTVLFTTVETNSRGEAGVEFTLPDNLTSWRVTYHGVTRDLQVNSGTTQIPVRLPFFVEMVVKENYLVGDVPLIVLRSYGEGVAVNTAVSYRMELNGPAGEKVSLKSQGLVGGSIDWQLPTLKEGKYTITVEGQAGQFTDKLRKEFTVVSSFLERTITTNQLLQENLQLAGSSEEPTLLVFSDEEKGQYLHGLYRLAWQSGGRLEQKLAAQEARRLLEQYFSKQNFSQSAEDTLQIYQQGDGGISILPYAGSEPVLTALVASIGSDDFDRRAMVSYLYSQLESGRDKGEDITPVLWGLGALGEPVLLEINSCLTQTDLAPEQKVYLALASLDIGNGAYAKIVYQELLAQYGEELGKMMRLKVGRDQDEIITATTQMALLAAKLGTVEKNKLYQYILENPGEELLNNLEQVQILKYNLRYMDSEPVSFSYELNGEKVQKTLKGRETFALQLLPGDLAQIKFSEIKGKVGVMTVYSQLYDQGQIPERNDDLEVKRTYRVQGKSNNNLQRGDLVEVVLECQIKNLAPRGEYELVDVLPAGLSYVQRPYRMTDHLSRDWTYPSEVKGQKITFNVIKIGQGDGTLKIVYYARVVSPGEFMAQGTLLSHLKSNDICIIGKENKVVIK